MYIIENSFLFRRLSENQIYKRKKPVLLLTELNFDYYLKVYNDIKNKVFGKMKTIGMIFYYSFLRCYLYFFVKLQINNKDIFRIRFNS